MTVTTTVSRMTYITDIFIKAKVHVLDTNVETKDTILFYSK